MTDSTRLQTALTLLHENARPGELPGMARFGIVGHNRLGLSMPALLTSRQLDAWAKGFESWDVCDQVCGSAFLGSPLAWHKVAVWSDRKDEYVRRAAFALLATLAVHDKQASDGQFIHALTLIEAAACDERNFVKKAVNWALRNIDKRNATLNAQAVEAARRIQQQGTRAARWIAADALRELGSDAVQSRLLEKSHKKRPLALADTA